MNLFLDYQKKIYIVLKKLDKKKILKIPPNIQNITIDLPPKNQEGDLSCNAALILSKINNKKPIEIAELLKRNFLLNFKEFKSIKIAGPGFININLHISFWKKYLTNVIKLNSKFGSYKTKKNKYNIEFVSANPTGPLHVGHCRGAIIGDTLSNLLTFNNNHVVKEYYVNDHGGQIKNFVSSVYYRILEILKSETFPGDENLYPGDYIIDIAKKAEDLGIKMITIHGRTRCQMFRGQADWAFINKVKKNVNIPVIANGDIVDNSDVKKSLIESNAD